MKVEVAVGMPECQWVVQLDLEAPVTVWEAIEQSGLAQVVPKLLIERERVGIFGQLVPSDRLLKPGDRVEIYRPLKADPKEVRRALAEVERQKKGSVV